MNRMRSLVTLVLLGCHPETPKYYMQDCTEDQCLDEDLECADTLFPDIAPARVCKLPCRADLDCPFTAAPGELCFGECPAVCDIDGYCREADTYWERST